MFGSATERPPGCTRPRLGNLGPRTVNRFELGQVLLRRDLPSHRVFVRDLSDDSDKTVSYGEVYDEIVSRAATSDRGQILESGRSISMTDLIAFAASQVGHRAQPVSYGGATTQEADIQGGGRAYFFREECLRRSAVALAWSSNLLRAVTEISHRSRVYVPVATDADYLWVELVGLTCLLNGAEMVLGSLGPCEDRWADLGITHTFLPWSQRAEWADFLKSSSRTKAGMIILESRSATSPTLSQLALPERGLGETIEIVADARLGLVANRRAEGGNPFRLFASVSVQRCSDGKMAVQSPMVANTLKDADS